jgi:hypothetical protein
VYDRGEDHVKHPARLGLFGGTALAAALLIATATPAGATTGSETVSAPAGGGAVSWVLAPSNITFPGVTLNGANQTVSDTSNIHDIQDTRGTGAGWNVTLQATNFVSGSNTMSSAALTFGPTSGSASPTWACDTGSTCTVASNTGTGATSPPVSVPLGGGAVKVLEAASATGLGQMHTTANAGYNLTVPANAIASATPYTATFTYTIGSAP